eukprot:8223992-Alexandrium_andersonii.AAC.1
MTHPCLRLGIETFSVPDLGDLGAKCRSAEASRSPTFRRFQALEKDASPYGCARAAASTTWNVGLLSDAVARTCECSHTPPHPMFEGLHIAGTSQGLQRTESIVPPPS